CVMSEKYEAEKARSLNFQRLLAQEEKRSSELDGEVKRTKREVSEYEARNRELGAQVEAVRQQAAQIQEEAQAMKEATLLEKRAHEDMKRLTTIPSKAKKGATASKKDFSSAVDQALKTEMASESKMETSGEMPGRGKTSLDAFGSDPPSEAGDSHTVRAGETLYRIGQKYHVGLDKLRKWNHLTGDSISVGQKLIVSPP
ncbi:MAG: LysM peptidoglycan-binding domain-containing protein, partial [Nitrospirota bacterium]|nr:LysM peptidoglycan-binding domain-containing protein [Nitrospirota bacterium]